MNLPNRLTLTRMIVILLSVIAMLVLECLPNFVAPEIAGTNINLVYLIFAAVFILAAFTDYLDGHIARKHNLVTTFGKFLDPIADKLLNDAMMIFLLVPQSYALVQRKDGMMLTILMICVILMIARDLLVDGMRLVASQKGIVVSANIFGKVKTVLQMISIPFLLLNDWPFSYFDSSWPEYLQVSNLLFYLATVGSLLSGIIYLIQNRKVFKDDIPLKEKEAIPEEEKSVEPISCDKSLECVNTDAKHLLDVLIEKGLTLGSVESLTGGKFSSAITSVAGSSKTFKGTLVTYTPEEKHNLADVSLTTIENYGVVSEQAAIEMARGGKKRLNVDVCVSVTGNAGPTSDVDNKPVGEVHIAVAFNNKITYAKFSLNGTREYIQSMCVKKMEQLVLFSLNN